MGARRWIVVVVAAMVGACGGSTAKVTPRATTTTLPTMNGSLSLKASSVFGVGKACVGSGGYSDIRPGAAVTIKDGSGTILAVSQLGDGTQADESHCVFTFTVPSVPAADFYQIEASHRGAVPFARTDLVTAGWQVHLTLGS